MKKLTYLLLVVMVFTLAACVAAPAVAPKSAMAQGLVALPDEGRILVLTLITAVVTFLLLKINMGQLTEPIVAILAPILITAIEAFLQTIPPVFDNLVLSIIHVIVLGVGSLGSYVLFKRSNTPKKILSGS